MRDRRGGEDGRGLTRRAFVGSAAATGTLAGLSLAGCGGPWARPRATPAPGDSPFRHGVASGDPLSDRVILWTRVSPTRADEPVDVRWILANDPDLSRVVARGSVATGPARDHTVKIDALGLAAGRCYFYRFEALGAASPVGRTRTLPAGPTSRLRLAVASCANYPQGFYNAYARIAARSDLDLVLHLGDYLYEYENGGYGDGTALGRIPEPIHETVSLADYRTRYACYRSDPDLQEVHRQHPMIAVWDDHESANDSWVGGAQNHDPATEGDWRLRKAAAIRAYHEWLPIRALPGEATRDRRGRGYRSFRIGDLADLVVLDTRLVGRDEPAAKGDRAAMADPRRTLLGAAQEAWLFDQLSGSRADGSAWRLVGQQVPFAGIAPPGEPPHPDKWGGYAASRERVLDHLEAGRIDDVVILTGDVHSSWAQDVPRDSFDPSRYDPRTGRGSLAVECITPAITSSPLGSFPGLGDRFARAYEDFPHLKFMDLHARGYVVLDVDRERAQAEWWLVDTVAERSDGERLAASLATRRGASHLEAAPASEPPEAPPPAP